MVKISTGAICSSRARALARVGDTGTGLEACDAQEGFLREIGGIGAIAEPAPQKLPHLAFMPLEQHLKVDTHPSFADWLCRDMPRRPTTNTPPLSLYLCKFNSL